MWKLYERKVVVLTWENMFFQFKYYTKTNSREHGTNGKEIARKVAEKLGVKFYDKEEIKKFAISHSLIEDNYTDDELYNFYLSLDAEKDSIIKQAETIKLIASEDNCVIVGRGSDYILKDNPNLIKILFQINLGEIKKIMTYVLIVKLVMIKL